MKGKSPNQTKNNKALEPGNTKMGQLKYAGENYMKIMFNKKENGEEIPTEWNLSYISSMYKKEDKKSTSNCRGISFMLSIAPIFAAVVNDKIEQHVLQKTWKYRDTNRRACTTLYIRSF